RTAGDFRSGFDTRVFPGRQRQRWRELYRDRQHIHHTYRDDRAFGQHRKHKNSLRRLIMDTRAQYSFGSVSRYSGFTLLEVLVTLFVIAIALLGTAGLQSY